MSRGRTKIDVDVYTVPKIYTARLILYLAEVKKFQVRACPALSQAGLLSSKIN